MQNLEQFKQKYRPVTLTNETEEFIVTDWGRAETLVSLVTARAENRLFTLICEGEQSKLVAGFYRINRLGYVITSVPYENEEEVYSC